MPKPKRYYVYYADQRTYKRLLAKRGGNHDDVDPADYWDEEEFDTVEQAKRFAATQKMDCSIYRRDNIRDDTEPELRALGITWASAVWDEVEIALTD